MTSWLDFLKICKIQPTRHVQILRSPLYLRLSKTKENTYYEKTIKKILSMMLLLTLLASNTIGFSSFSSNSEYPYSNIMPLEDEELPNIVDR